MVDSNNKYTQMQKSFYDASASKMASTNHQEHNDNPDYWNILLGDLNDDTTNKSVGLDFGCGCGRNVYNLLKNWNWERVDGIDISGFHIAASEQYLRQHGLENKSKFYVNNGVDLKPLKTNEYNFVMSTIVFQHIAVHEIRYKIMEEIYRVLKSGGLFSFQMGFGNNPKFKTVGYFENYYDAQGTNSDCDVRVENAEDLISDLKKIGFTNITYTITPSWSNAVHEQWIYVKAWKNHINVIID
jgi:ubiquinone/menaquinone biosynthesis C-methylase UbiE